MHIGECDPASADGPVQATSTALADAAATGQVLVSRMIVDLVSGSGLVFSDRQPLRGGGGGARELPVLSATRVAHA